MTSKNSELPGSGNANASHGQDGRGVRGSLFRTPELVIALICLVVFSGLSWYGFLDGLEVKTLDFRFRLTREEKTDDQVMILYITDECIEKLGSWPWPRSRHAKVVDILSRAGAKLIVFDVIFKDSSKDNPADDVDFVAACASAGNVIFPIMLEQVKILDPDTLELKTELEVSLPMPAIASVSRGLGFINVDYQNLNPDGIIRRLPLVMGAQDKVFPALDLAVVQAYRNASFTFQDRRLFLGNSEIPLTEVPGAGWMGSEADSFFRKSFPVKFLGEATSGVFSVAYYSDLVSGIMNLNSFKDKIVLIGPSAVGLSDIKLTPYREMPGVMIHANVIQNMLKGNYLFHPEGWVQIGILVLLAILTFFALTLLKPLTGFLAALFLAALFDGLSVACFLSFSLVLDMVCPTLLIGTIFLSGRFFQMIQNLQSAYQSLKERSLELERSNLLLDMQVRDLSNLNEASRRFASTLDMEFLAREILHTFQMHVGASRGLISFVEQENDSLQTITYTGMSEEESRLLMFEPRVAKSIGRLLEERAIISDRGGEWFTRFIPLQLGSKLWGAVLLKEDSPQLVQEERINFWSTLSGLASTALENARLYNLATVDNLTRLYVRRYFQFQIEQEFKRARRYRHRLALLMTDIDHFKTFNDTYGHQQGDVVLREVAAAAKRSLREIDIACRYGGEEFSIVLPETDLTGAIIAAERIRRNVEELLVARISSEGEPLKVTLSVGIASFPDHSPTTSEEMIKIADGALYRAKAKGRNRVETDEGKPDAWGA